MMKKNKLIVSAPKLENYKPKEKKGILF